MPMRLSRYRTVRSDKYIIGKLQEVIIKVTKKIITCAALAVMCVSSMALPTAYAAGDDDYDFLFFIGSFKANRQDMPHRYRGCNDPKVKLSNSGEGKGTKTNF